MDVKKKYPETYKAIMEAFAGESQARNKYDFFAKVARKDGHQKLAEFFEETARNECEHAKLLFKLVSGISGTANNLKAAAAGENFENTSMYPRMAKTAKQEGFNDAKKLFNLLGKIEKEHEDRFNRLLKEFENDSLYKAKESSDMVWKCRKCGHVHSGDEAPNKCPVCKHPQGYFEREVHLY